MPCYVGCMLWCNLLQCFCYLMAFLVILDSQFILIYTKKSTPTTPLNFWLAAQKIMASLSPPPASPPRPPSKKNAFLEVTEVITSMFCFPLLGTNSFLPFFFMQTRQKIALFCEPTLQTKNKLFMLPFFS